MPASTPCAGMVVGWTGLGRGNVPLALVTVVVSLLLSVFAVVKLSLSAKRVGYAGRLLSG